MQSLKILVNYSFISNPQLLKILIARLINIPINFVVIGLFLLFDFFLLCSEIEFQFKLNLRLTQEKYYFM